MLKYPCSRPHRLTVRTPGFHPGNRGSIPLEVTKESARALSRVFSLVIPMEWNPRSGDGRQAIARRNLFRAQLLRVALATIPQIAGY
jgi:hypothetical protein